MAHLRCELVKCTLGKRDEVEYVYISNENAKISDFGLKLAYFKRTKATLRRCPKGAYEDWVVTLPT